MREDIFPFRLLIMLGNQMDHQPSCSQCSYPLLQVSYWYCPQPRSPASSPWHLHRGPFSNYCPQYILNFVPASALTHLSAKVSPRSLPRDPSPPPKPSSVSSFIKPSLWPSPISMAHYLYLLGLQNFLPPPIVMGLDITFLWGYELLEDKSSWEMAVG